MPKSYVFDIKPYRDSLKRTVVLTNMTSNKNEIEFELFYIDPNHGKWVKNDDNGNVRGYLDWENIKIDHWVKLSDIPYIALLQEDKDRNIYNFKLYPKNNKLIIEIYNK